jgi:hypothetical protein
MKIVGQGDATQPPALLHIIITIIISHINNINNNYNSHA